METRIDRAERAGASPAERAAIDALRALLDDLAYAQLYGQVAGGQLYAADPAAALERLDALPEPERSTLRALAFGAPIAEDGLRAPLAPVLDALAGADLARRRGGEIATTGWVVVPALRGVLITGLPATYTSGGAIGASGYLGADSLRLASSLPRVAGKRVLDLGAGCGVQGLLAAAGAREAVLTDIDPFSLRASALNAVLNEVSHPVRVLAGDLFAPVEGERFDLIAVLPPYVPSVPGAATSRIVDGGLDGLAFIRRVVAGAREVLADGGELVALCQLFCDRDGPLLARELPELAPGLEARLLLEEWHPLQPYVVELATRLAAHGAPAGQRGLIASYSASLRALGITGVATALVRLRRAGRAEVEVLGDRPGDATGTFRHVPGLVIEEDRSLRVVRVGGRSVVLNGPSVALLQAIDGRRSLDEIVEAAWGSPPGASTVDLREQALERIGEFSRAGLLESAAPPPVGC